MSSLHVSLVGGDPQEGKKKRKGKSVARGGKEKNEERKRERCGGIPSSRKVARKEATDLLADRDKKKDIVKGPGRSRGKKKEQVLRCLAREKGTFIRHLPSFRWVRMIIKKRGAGERLEKKKGSRANTNAPKISRSAGFPQRKNQERVLWINKKNEQKKEGVQKKGQYDAPVLEKKKWGALPEQSDRRPALRNARIDRIGSLRLKKKNTMYEGKEAA